MDRIGLAILIVAAVVFTNGALGGRAYGAPLAEGLGFAGPASEIADTSATRVVPGPTLLDTKASTRLLVETGAGGELGSAGSAAGEFAVRG